MGGTFLSTRCDSSSVRRIKRIFLLGVPFRDGWYPFVKPHLSILDHVGCFSWNLSRWWPLCGLSFSIECLWYCSLWIMLHCVPCALLLKVKKWNVVVINFYAIIVLKCFLSMRNECISWNHCKRSNLLLLIIWVNELHPQMDCFLILENIVINKAYSCIHKNIILCICMRWLMVYCLMCMRIFSNAARMRYSLALCGDLSLWGHYSQSSHVMWLDLCLVLFGWWIFPRVVWAHINFQYFPCLD